jgi:hypothetical protein
VTKIDPRGGRRRLKGRPRDLWQGFPQLEKIYFRLELISNSLILLASVPQRFLGTAPNNFNDLTGLLG